MNAPDPNGSPVPSIREYLAEISGNIDRIFTGRPQISGAAEAVSSGFKVLLNDATRANSQGSLLATVMGGAAHQAWMDAILFTCAGNTATGMSVVRRSIEFAYYAAKVVNNPERVRIWARQLRDPAERKRFVNLFTIPSGYWSEDYGHLRTLLYWYDKTSEWGVHANVESIVDMFAGVQDGQYMIAYQANQETIETQAVYINLIGLRVLDAFETTLAGQREEPEMLNQALQYARQSVGDMRLGYARFKSQNKPLPQVLVNELANNTAKVEESWFAQKHAEWVAKREREAAQRARSTEPAAPG